jgi:hypothetical protein
MRASFSTAFSAVSGFALWGRKEFSPIGRQRGNRRYIDTSTACGCRQRPAFGPCVQVKSRGSQHPPAKTQDGLQRAEKENCSRRCCRRVRRSEIAPRAPIRQRRSMHNLVGDKRSASLLPRSEPMVRSERSRRWKLRGHLRSMLRRAADGGRR